MPKPASIAIAATLIAGAALKLLWPSAKGAEFSREATVTRASGVDLSPGDRCTVSVRNESRGGFACRVSVECGGIALFGGRIPGGYAICTERDGRWIRAEDHELASKDGDPALDLDVEQQTVVVRTERARIEARLGGSLSPSRTVAARLGAAQR